jgi:hypothetical protein
VSESLFEKKMKNLRKKNEFVQLGFKIQQVHATATRTSEFFVRFDVLLEPFHSSGSFSFIHQTSFLKVVLFFKIKKKESTTTTTRKLQTIKNEFG